MSTRVEIGIAAAVVVVLVLVALAVLVRRRPRGADADRFHHLQHVTNAWSAGHAPVEARAAEPVPGLSDEQAASLGFSAIRGEPAKIHLTRGRG